MATLALILTAEESRVVRQNEPTFSNNQGIDLPARLETHRAAVEAALTATEGVADTAAADLADIPSGLATVLNATTSITVTAATLGGSFGGSPVALTFAEAPTAATLLFATWSGNDLVINVDQDNTANVDVYFVVDGR